jgi:hypothetical protein
MNERRYILEPYKGMSSRYHCPSCEQKGKTFSRYIDTETGEHIHTSVGRCNRESKCGYHYTPKQYFQDNNISIDTIQLKTHMQKPITSQKPISYIPVEVFKASLNPTVLETNHFVKFLINLFGVNVASQQVSRYFIATSKYWNGATVFWQIDTQGKVRTGKIMLYSPKTGKRVKEPFNHINWVHSLLKQPGFELKQCMYGEHLLVDKTKPVAIVESEKTAVIASVYLPQFIWLAAGSLTNLNAEKCFVLRGRNVVLFPDLNGFNKWSDKANELSSLGVFIVSDLLEGKATDVEKKQGYDIADYLLKLDWRQFRGEASIEQKKPEQRKPDVRDGCSILKNKLQNEHVNTSPDETGKSLPEYRTIGSVFDFYKNKGYKSLVEGGCSGINTDKWKSQMPDDFFMMQKEKI